MTRKENAERQEAIEKLRKWIKPGDTVYTILRHVSRSGMQREIGVVLMDGKSDLHPNWAVSKAIGQRQGKSDGIVMGGCGMDMGFALVYELGSVLYPNGFDCIGEGCPSNDHSNLGYMKPEELAGLCRDHVEQKEGVCRGECKPWHHKSGGYALRQRWL